MNKKQSIIKINRIRKFILLKNVHQNIIKLCFNSCFFTNLNKIIITIIVNKKNNNKMYSPYALSYILRHLIPNIVHT